MYVFFFFTDCLFNLYAGFQLYEGSAPIKDGLYLPVGVGSDDHDILLQVNVRDCNMASTSLFISATVSILQHTSFLF